MQFVRIIDGYDHLWAVKDPEKEYDELTELFNKWNNAKYLLDFFMANLDDLKTYFHIEKVSRAIQDTFEDADELEELIMEFPYTEHLDELFRPLGAADAGSVELARQKAKNWDRNKHASWLRIYAIRLEKDVYIVTGGAIKLTATMQERAHTALELEKLDRCKSYLKANGVFDQDSFIDLNLEERI